MVKSEVELCEEFIQVATREGYQIYPEVSNWDVIVVNDAGDQLGVQAKLHANVKVLAQAIGPGPTYRAVLVPRATRDFRKLTYKLGLGLYTYNHITLANPRRPLIKFEPLTRWTDKKMWLPPVPSACSAGMPSPRPLTTWRVQAIRLCHLLEERGYVTGLDFKRLGLKAAGWLNRGELIRAGRMGRYAKYVAGKKPLPIVGFECESEQLKRVDR